MELTLYSYPKINIGLYIGKKRPDGFHELSSIFYKPHNIYDLMKFSFSKGEMSIEIKGLPDCVKVEDSSIYKAAAEWMKKTEIYGKLIVDIDKKIPMKAGLGGGSSNAGSTIVALETLTGNKTSKQDIVKIASTIGSDVPFFALNYDAAFVTGRGEFCTEIPYRKDLKIELFESEVAKLSTKDAYYRLDQGHTLDTLPSKDELVSIYMDKVENWNFENSFEILSKKPCVSVLKQERLYMTGSGNNWYKVQD